MEEIKSAGIYSGVSSPLNGDKPAASLGNRLQELQDRLSGIVMTSSELADRIGGSSMVAGMAGEKLSGAPEQNDLVSIATRIIAVADRIERNLNRAYNSL